MKSNLHVIVGKFEMSFYFIFDLFRAASPVRDNNM